MAGTRYIVEVIASAIQCWCWDVVLMLVLVLMSVAVVATLLLLMFCLRVLSDLGQSYCCKRFGQCNSFDSSPCLQPGKREKPFFCINPVWTGQRQSRDITSCLSCVILPSLLISVLRFGFLESFLIWGPGDRLMALVYLCPAS